MDLSGSPIDTEMKTVLHLHVVKTKKNNSETQIPLTWNKKFRISNIYDDWHRFVCTIENW